ncbi:hypothetical protein [Streptomyces sp. NPDC097619]|uniref:hypothetical protein n=1 Tax=Streptomyces sp. NPDC097619 TaxID=3157228 RepID=UPI003326758A
MSDDLREAWLRGIAANPAAPADALVRLLDPAAGAIGPPLCESRDLPGAFLEVVLRHPDRTLRQALARNRHVDPVLLAPLAADPSGLVRARLAAGPWPRPRRVRPLPDETLVALMTATDGGADGRLTAGEIAAELESSRQIPLAFRRAMAGHPHPGIRIRATFDWTARNAAERRALLDDPDPEVRESARQHSWIVDPRAAEARLPTFGTLGRPSVLSRCALTPAVVDQCLADGTVWPLAVNPHTPPGALARLARHPDPRIRAQVAARPDLAPGPAAELRTDPDASVRLRARLRPATRTWSEHDALDWVLGHGLDCTCPIMDPLVGPDGGPSPEWIASCAVSEEPALRRVAASRPDLPAEPAAALARDEDEEVRIRLACHHPSAPAGLLLEVFTAHPVHRPHLRSLPGFPRAGTAHLVGHPDPEVRALAAVDPALPVPPLADPDPLVRRAAAANPSLTPSALEALLGDPRTAEGAAANPSLPAARMHALLDHCLGTTGTATATGEGPRERTGLPAEGQGAGSVAADTGSTR